MLPVDELIPKKGVYAVITELDDVEHYGVCNIGYNPTFGENAMSIETHILDFSEDILGKEFKIKFMYRLRDERPFKNAQELSVQISKDISRARELFGIHE